MKQNCKRIFSLLLCAALVCALFAGCGGRNKQLDIIYPITGNITSFDPQVAATQDEYLIAENCYEGLVRVEDDGTVKPAVAADWTVSTDQKTYTFHLRQGLKWHLTDAVTERMGKNWDPDITAHDFVFALQRAVSPQTACPLYPALSGIAGAQQVYTKQKSASALQVKATDDYTLVITLRTPDAGFFSTLSGAAAMPCNKEFFTATKGRYGLGTEYSLFNGQFYVKNQLDTSYTLNINQEYKGANPTKVDNITLNIKDENSKVPEKLESGYYDAAFLTGSEYGALKKKDDLTAIPYANTTWAFLLNTNQGSLSNEKMRRAICLSLSPADTKNSKYLQASTGITPPSTTVDGGNVTTAKSSLVPARDAARAQTLWKAGLEETGLTTVALTVITTPEMDAYAKALVQGVQSSLGSVTTYGNGTGIAFSLKIETMTKAEMESQMAAGTYDIALYPMEAASQSPVTFLSDLLSTNYMKLQSDKIERALTVAKNATAGTATAACRACEQALIQTGAVLPVFYESAYYVMAGGVSGVQFHPGSGRVSFVEAVRT